MFQYDQCVQKISQRTYTCKISANVHILRVMAITIPSAWHSNVSCSLSNAQFSKQLRSIKTYTRCPIWLILSSVTKLLVLVVLVKEVVEFAPLHSQVQCTRPSSRCSCVLFSITHITKHGLWTSYTTYPHACYEMQYSYHLIYIFHTHLSFNKVRLQILSLPIICPQYLQC